MTVISPQDTPEDFLSPHMTNNIQYCRWQIWRQNGWKKLCWPSNQCIKKHHSITIDWNSENFCGIKLKWDYDKKTVDISMQNYVNKVLVRLHHPPPIKPHHSHHPYYTPIYGNKCQFVIPTITNEKLTPIQLKHCQECCGFSIIIIDLLTTPWIQTSAPLPNHF